MFANHGRQTKFGHALLGVNSRLDGLQAAILNVKLKYLDEWNRRRREIARTYDEQLRGFATTPAVLPDVVHSYHLYVVQVKNREQIRASLRQKGIATGVHYPTPLPFLEAFAYLGHKASEFPVAHSLKDTILSLPIHGNLTNAQVEYVVEHLKKAVEAHG